MNNSWYGTLHFHSCHSYDSITSISKITELAAAHRFNFMMLTDHDTIEGSVALRREVQRQNLPVEVPLAAEYKTSCGDVIAAFIKREIQSRAFEEFVKEVREQDGLLLLPHPYQQHTHLEMLATTCDLIEVFNPRVSDEKNILAAALAKRLGKPGYYGSDAHMLRSVALTAVRFENQGDLKKSLTQSLIECTGSKKSSWAEMIASQYVKSLKDRDLKLFLSLTGAVGINGILKRRLFSLL